MVGPWRPLLSAKKKIIKDEQNQEAATWKA